MEPRRWRESLASSFLRDIPNPLVCRSNLFLNHWFFHLNILTLLSTNFKVYACMYICVWIYAVFLFQFLWVLLNWPKICALLVNLGTLLMSYFLSLYLHWIIDWICDISKTPNGMNYRLISIGCFCNMLPLV